MSMNLPTPPGKHYSSNHASAILQYPGDCSCQGSCCGVSNTYSLHYGVRRQGSHNGAGKCLLKLIKKVKLFSCFFFS